MSMTASLKTLQKVPSIQYQFKFQNGQLKIKTLINSNNKVNTITLAYTIKLDFIIQKTSFKAQKINGSLLEIFNIVLACFLLQDNLEKVCFFEKTFLLADINIEIVLELWF